MYLFSDIRGIDLPLHQASIASPVHQAGLNFLTHVNLWVLYKVILIGDQIHVMKVVIDKKTE